MAFEDLRDQAVERVQAFWGRIQDDPGFIRMQERYQSLPPIGQKAVAAGLSLLALYIVLMIPLSYYSSSSDSVAYFEENKELIENLFTTRRDAGILKAAPQQIDQGQIISQAQAKVTQAGIPPERVQVEGYEQIGKNRTGSPVIPKSVDETGARVIVSKLNLTQLVDIGHSLMTISNGVKMLGIDIKAAADDPRYFDVTYKLAHFRIPQPPAPPAGARGRARSSGNTTDEDQ